MEPTNKKVMLIDDNCDDKNLFQMALKQVDASTEFVYASDGVAALALLADMSILPHYIFLDLNMHRMDGKECLAEIKKSPRLCGIDVVINSTSRRESDVEETRALGACCFAVKPMNFNELIELIRFILNEELRPGQYLFQAVEVF